MSKRDKMGAWLLVGLFVLLGVALYISLPKHEGEARSPEDSVVVQQRMKNLEKSRGVSP